MSARSIQARKLARALSAQTCVPVEVAFDGRKGYLVQWGNGPTVDAMAGRITAELGTGAYPSLPASKLSAFRGTTARAFAARAAAALRTGTLAEAVRAGVAYREQHDVTPPAWSRLSAADCAAHQHIEDELDKLSYPERPDDPDDEPVIEALLAGSKSNEYAMLPALAAAIREAEEGGREMVDEVAFWRDKARTITPEELAAARVTSPQTAASIELVQAGLAAEPEAGQ